MSKLRIKDAPLLDKLIGDEKIPTGGRGDFATNPDQIVKYVEDNSNLVNGGDLSNLENKMVTRIREHENDTKNPHGVTKDQIGLGNVNNTSDLDKPINTQTQKELDKKANKTEVDSVKSDLLSVKQNKADKSVVDNISSDVSNIKRTKADVTYVDEKLSAVAGGLGGSYKTYDEALADKDNWKPNTSIQVTNDPDVEKNGLYTWDGVSLTKSEYDPKEMAYKYTDSKIRVVNNEEELKLPTTTKVGYVKTLDTGNVWEWNGLAWHDTGLSELDRANSYTDTEISTKAVIFKDTPTPSDIKDIVENGTYYLPSGAFTGFPSIFDGGAAQLIVRKTHKSYVTQELYSFTKPQNNWMRRVHVGATNKPEGWVESNNFVDAISSSDIFKTLKQGRYVVSDTTALPSDWGTGSAFLDIENYSGGTFRKYTLSKISEPSLIYYATSSKQTWRQIQTPKPTDLNTSNLADNYSFRGMITDADANMILATGGYLLNGAHTNTPLTGTLRFEVLNLTSAIVQRAFNAADPSKLAQRTRMVDKVWGDWSFIGSNAVVDGLNVSNFADDFTYRGIVTDADANTLLATGDYILNGAHVNTPLTGTLRFEVAKMGAFYTQRCYSSKNPSKLAQRTYFQSSGNTWGDWSFIGASESTSKLAGKTIAFFGDSMIDSSTYPSLIATDNDCNALNFGFAGLRATHYPTRLGSLDEMCFYKLVQYIESGDFTGLKVAAEKAKSDYNYNKVAKVNRLAETDFNKVDILVVGYGTNDWSSATTTIGESIAPDSSGLEYKSTMSFCIETLLGKYPHLQIVLLSPTWRKLSFASGDPDRNSDDSTGLSDEWLYDYVKALIEVGDKYHLPTFDFYRQGGINAMNWQQYLLTDGVHQNSFGHRYWANRVESFLKSSV